MAPTKQPEKETFNGTRKLIRPSLAGLSLQRRRDPGVTEDPLSHATLSDNHGVPESSHAEVFYFQKQIQQQTEMTIVMDDGEELQGVIQWFDKCVVKLRVGRQRVMIYKSCIKYLYKTSDAQQHAIMK
ncbi:RNA chaperone Hfq [Granulicella cerasi]|uniref:RNA chaperone Hfq n=1 Tax=Granulicella cerasi TaxID=741063 RepID=A0ABW1Z4U3_9BACT|nr:RNA chaperone Hfq [Granulicella cerasi]